MADFKTEISRNYSTIVVVISCPSRADLDEYLDAEFPSEPAFRDLLKGCEWTNVTGELIGGLF